MSHVPRQGNATARPDLATKSGVFAIAGFSARAIAALDRVRTARFSATWAHSRHVAAGSSVTATDTAYLIGAGADINSFTENFRL